MGHGTRSADELADLLRERGIVGVIDVRRFPGSRRHPHFGRDEMERWLPKNELSYEWWGDELGGRRNADPATRHSALRVAAFRGYADHMDTELFRGSLSTLMERAEDAPLAVMCAETLWWRCHRRMIADALLAQGCEMLHVIGPGKVQAHVLHPAARIDADGYPVYDVGTTPPTPTLGTVAQEFH